MPRLVTRFGRWTRSLGYGLVTVGSLLMWSGPGLASRVLGIVVVAFGSAPLYPLAVEALYAKVEADSVSLGALTALASGVAITTGPLIIGVLADAIGLRTAVLFTTALAVIGVIVNRPRPVPVAAPESVLSR
jgi:MFS family permease